ncbi:MAG: Na/Pi symporter [Deltaproteobacteria bacterium]|jgi:sodium-dependent phosphate cotransporter
MGPTDGILQPGPDASSDAINASDAKDLPAGEAEAAGGSSWTAYFRPLLALLLLFLFLVGVQALSTGIKGLGSGVIDGLIAAVQNPFTGLVTGILATTLVQSSSVTTSLVVGLTASGVLPIQNAIPIVMGANIGTTVTNTVAALAQIGRRTEFRRAFAAATCHDFFNYLTVLALLPLEIATGVLQKTSAWLVGLFPATAATGATYKSPLKSALKGCVHAMESTIDFLTADAFFGSILLIVLAFGLIFLSLMLIVRVMKSLVLSRMEGFIRKVLGRGFKGGVLSIVSGAVLTVLVQSSSITTSVMVPLAGAGVVRLWQVFPVTIGANIGTTVTALIAASAVSGPAADLARQIAIVHLLFNLMGTALFYVPPMTRRWPMKAAQWLAGVAVKSKRWALIYVVGAFYGVPAALVFLSRSF